MNGKIPIEYGPISRESRPFYTTKKKLLFLKKGFENQKPLFLLGFMKTIDDIKKMLYNDGRFGLRLGS